MEACLVTFIQILFRKCGPNLMYVIYLRCFTKDLFYIDCLVGQRVASATAELEVLGSIPGSDKVLLGFSIRNFTIAVTESGLVYG